MSYSINSNTYQGTIAASMLTMAALVWLFLADQGNEPIVLGDDDDSAGDDDDSSRYDRLPPVPKD